MPHPKVFIIILNWNGLKDTLECLESVFKLDYPNFEVIVVDNGSTDNSVEVIRKAYPQVILIENKENLGYAEGNNVGIRYALKHGADYVWLLNNDTVVDADSLTKLVMAAEKSPDIGLVSPVIYYYDEPDKIQFCGSYIDWKNHIIVYPENRNSILNVDHEFITGKNVCLWGTALLIRRNLIENIGTLEEKYFAYWEDTEYSVRSMRAGYRNIIEPSAKVYHKLPFGKVIVNRGSHYFYYMTRNEYFFWMQYLEGLNKLSYFRMWLAKVIGNAALCRYYNASESADACFEGAYSALCGLSGPWDKNRKMPQIIKRIFLWHPYFWVSLLKGDFLHLVSEVLRRAKIKLIG